MKVTDAFNPKYAAGNGIVQEVLELDNGFVVPIDAIQATEHVEIFETLREAQYHNALEKMLEGESLEDMKPKNLYQYYRDRLKKEHPELLV
jgi:hypothetical protein